MNNAPSLIDPGPPSITVSLHREAIADTAWRACVYAQHACEYAQLGDDRGLQRSLRMLAICAAHAANALPALAQAVEADDRMGQSARAASSGRHSNAEGRL
jgi:hypothetical protein